MAKLSIVIPTKNRYSTLFPVVENLLKYIIGNNYEIIIHDNSDDNRSAMSFISKINDARIKYYYTNEALSQVTNSESALSKAIGEYLIYIGDDDLVSPFILETINMMDDMKIECLIYSPANYWWPDVKFAKKSRMRQPSSLQMPKKMTTDLVKLNSATTRDAVIKNGGFSMMNLPKCYHAIICRSALIRIKDKFGVYIPGPCPDMTLAMALSFVVDEYYLIGYPQSITGASSNSAAGLGTASKLYSKLDSPTFLLNRSIDLSFWDNKIPYIWTASTIYAQCVSEVCKKADYNLNLNYLNLYARIAVKEKYAEYETKILTNKLNLSEKKVFKQLYINHWVRCKIVFVLDIILGGISGLSFTQNTGVSDLDKCINIFMKKILQITK